MALGEIVFSFDGRVFEVFGSYAQGSLRMTSVRVLASQRSVEVEGPDRKGRYEVDFRGPSDSTRIWWEFDDATEWGSMQPLLDALRSVGAEFKT